MIAVYGQEYMGQQVLLCSWALKTKRAVLNFILCSTGASVDFVVWALYVLFALIQLAALQLHSVHVVVFRSRQRASHKTGCYNYQYVKI